jgi:co-chaperonin GroES (HSP10)
MNEKLLERVQGWRGIKGPNPGNDSGFQVTGHRLLLKPEGGEKITEGGIVIPDASAHKSESQSVWAEVLEVGTECYTDKLTDYCTVGDRVLVGKYAGKFEKSPKDGKIYRFLNDLDVIAVLTED